jgi:endonuclease YncB( thermonuclease family)
VSKHWKPAKKTVTLDAPTRPSRIRREPPPLVDPAEAEKKAWRSAEWDRRFVIAGVTLFALAISAVIIGFSAMLGDVDNGAAARAQRFAGCGTETGSNCVVDGDTIQMGGQRIDIAGLQAPQIETARCVEEQRRGAEALERLIGIMNSGKVAVGAAVIGPNGELRRRVTVAGRDVAAAMVAAHAARPADGTSASWCG